MTPKLKLTIMYGILSFALCYFTPWGVVAVVTSILLFAFVLWSERFTVDQSKEFSEKLKSLESRVNTINFSKGLSGK